MAVACVRMHSERRTHPGGGEGLGEGDKGGRWALGFGAWVAGRKAGSSLRLRFPRLRSGSPLGSDRADRNVCPTESPLVGGSACLRPAPTPGAGGGRPGGPRTGREGVPPAVIFVGGGPARAGGGPAVAGRQA